MLSSAPYVVSVSRCVLNWKERTAADGHGLLELPKKRTKRLVSVHYAEFGDKTERRTALVPRFDLKAVRVLCNKNSDLDGAVPGVPGVPSKSSLRARRVPLYTNQIDTI